MPPVKTISSRAISIRWRVSPGALGLTDDAAVLRAGGDDIVVTADACFQGGAFPARRSAGTVAARRCGSTSPIMRKGAAPAASC